MVARHDNTFRNDVSRRGKIYIYMSDTQSLLLRREWNFRMKLLTIPGGLFFANNFQCERSSEK